MTDTTWVKFDAELHYAKVFERNRDRGNEHVNLDQFEGMYKVDVVVDDDTKQMLIKKGIPDGTGRMQQAWKETEDGRWRYTLKRKHFNPNMRNSKNEGYMGPPDVIDYGASKEESKAIAWDTEVNIGNGSKGLVKISIYKGKATIITLEGIAIKELVPYEPTGDYIEGF